MLWCQHCRLWNPSHPDAGEFWGSCGRVSASDHPTDAKFSVQAADLLETAELFTRRDFGCVEAQPKLKRIISANVTYEEYEDV